MAYQIKQATFVKSSTAVEDCPAAPFPEYAFIGRSNVGKSTLFNMLVDRKKLAHISSKPGKTQTINHYLINNNLYLADLPGYGYAKASKKAREEWGGFIADYILKRKNLVSLFVLIDSRIKPQKIDLDFHIHIVLIIQIIIISFLLILMEKIIIEKLNQETKDLHFR